MRSIVAQVFQFMAVIAGIGTILALGVAVLFYVAIVFTPGAGNGGGILVACALGVALPLGAISLVCFLISSLFPK